MTTTATIIEINGAKAILLPAGVSLDGDTVELDLDHHGILHVTTTQQDSSALTPRHHYIAELDDTPEARTRSAERILAALRNIQPGDVPEDFMSPEDRFSGLLPDQDRF